MSKRTEKTDQKPTAEPAATPNKIRPVEAHRHCPVCHGRMGGIGNAQSSRNMKTYYKCQTCGHGWTVTVKKHAVVVEHRTVEVQTR